MIFDDGICMSIYKDGYKSDYIYKDAHKGEYIRTDTRVVTQGRRYNG